ncbi:MAG TPA: hypothetical protein VLG50_02040, partial [Candidatus Saccharimonadales bacterium]|nr:hypothetical protein [Candidatus Saccharimonadales bacterium]
MNKKSLFLLFLLGTCSCQALWELPAAFLMGMAARTSLGKRATSFVFSTCKKALLCRGLNCNVEISSIINPSGKSSGLAYFGNATKAMAIKSRASISSCMVACMTRVKEMQKKNFADQDIPQPASDFRRVQYVYTQQEAKAAQQDQAVEKDQNSTQFIKADAQIDARV